MNPFCILLALPGEGLVDRADLRRMAASSRHTALRDAGDFGTSDFAAAAPQHAGAGGVWMLADARLDERDELRAAVDPWLPPSSTVPSDADLILAAYLRWGTDCPGHLLGDFSFAVWDQGRRRVFGARAPLGTRLLYHARLGRQIGIATEPLPLLAHPAASFDIDPITVGEYLTGSILSLDRSFFRQIRKLPPGHRWMIDPSGERIDRFWEVPQRILSYSRKEEYGEHFLSVFERSVRARLPEGDTVVGVALSGGLDSGAVAAVARREMVRTSRRQGLVAGSFHFPSLPDCDERPYIDATVDFLGIESFRIDAQRHWFLGDRQAYTPAFDTPALSWDGLYAELLKRFRERGARVILTGHGADDLLSGSFLAYADQLRSGDFGAAIEVWRHSRKSRQHWRSFYRYLARPLLFRRGDGALRRLLGRRSVDPVVPDWISPAFAREVDLLGKLRSHRAPNDGKSTARSEMHYHLVTRPLFARSIEWYDRVGASLDIEFRHPFLDRHLFELVLSFPARELVQLGTYKPLLRQALTGLLPDSVRLRKRKSRLGGFVDWSLRNKAVTKIENLLEEPVAAEMGFLDGKALRRAFQAYKAGDPDEDKRALWYAITLELWLRQYRHRLQAPVASA